MTKPITTIAPADIVAAFRAQFAAKLSENAAGIDPHLFTVSLINDLKRQQTEVIATLLGLEKAHDGWRSRYSSDHNPLRALFEQHAKPAVEEWVVSATHEELGRQRGELEKAVRRSVKLYLREEVDGVVMDLVRNLAREIVSETLEAVKADFLQK